MIESTKSKFFTRDILETGERILNHQCWFFGRDIHHPEGNLLIRYGFERCGVPEGAKGGNLYHLAQCESQELALWGFGIFWWNNSLGGIFIRRFRFMPKYYSPALAKPVLPVYQSNDMPVSIPVIRRKHLITIVFLLSELAEWIGEYERWVEEQFGKTWRARCLRDWKNAELTPAQIRKGWQQIGRLQK